MQKEFTKAVVGDYVIINFWDSPCARLVARVVDVEPNIVRAEYLSSDTSLQTCAAHPDQVRTIADFGVEMQFIGNGYVCSKVQESQVHYSDGEVRPWQDPEFLKIQKLRNPLLARAVERAVSN